MSVALIRYLRDCYEEDNRRLALRDVFKSSVRRRIILEGTEDLLTGSLTRIPLPAEEGRHLHEEAAQYAREAEVLYVSMFVVGRTGERDGEGEETSAVLCAPLVLFPAQVILAGPYAYAEPDLAERRLNTEALVDAWGQEAHSVIELLEHYLLQQPVEPVDLYELGEALRGVSAEIDAEPLRGYPALSDAATLRRAAREAAASGVLRLVPASAVVLAPRARAAQGVIAELDGMAGSARRSPPVQVLLGEASSTRPFYTERGRVPAILSAAQERILDSATAAPATVVVGPPGTGKSFTIAALVIEHLSRGQTVLIASRTDPAVDVVAEKIEQQLGIRGVLMRGGRASYQRELKTYLEQVLSGLHTQHVPTVDELSRARQGLDAHAVHVAELQARLDRRLRQEQQWGRVLADESALALRAWWVGWRAGRAMPVWHLADQVEEALDEQVRLARQYVQAVNQRRLGDVLKQHRRTLQTFDQALRARTSGRQAKLFEQIDLNVLLKAFPVWLVNLGDVARVLPFEPELFDLVILDEASQCDIASALPVLQRARRAVVVGDPAQLRHLSFLPMARQHALARKHALTPDQAETFDYRAQSILDAYRMQVSSQAQVEALTEHYRSTPGIIGFSNDQFYGGTLRTMTARPGPVAPSLWLHPCGGTRDAQGVNEVEVRRIVEAVAHRIEQEEKAVQPVSIGVLSPFRAQVDALKAALREVLPARALERHRVLAGTAHAFQGEERDVMLLSFALDATSHTAAFRFAEQPDVLNVAVTRARAEQHVYTSVHPADVPEGLLRAYLAYAEAGGVRPAAPPDDARDRFAQDVAYHLALGGLEAQVGFPLAGLYIDVVAYRHENACGIDLVGYPGAYEGAFDQERYRMWQRAGLPVRPLSYARWHLDRAACLRDIHALLG